jgi:hypothetical protein
MAVFVPCLNMAQFSLIFNTPSGDIAENNLWIRRSAAWDNAHLNTMANALVTWFSTGDGVNSYRDQMSNQCSLASVAWRDHTTVNGLSNNTQAGLPLAGTDLTEGTNPGLTKAFTLRTGLAGKSFRGRIFFVGMPANVTAPAEQGLVSAGWTGPVSSALAALIAAVPAADASAVWAVVSRFYQPGGPNTPTVPRAAGIYTPVTGVGVSNLAVDFQRRRAPAHSRHH